MNRIFFLMAFCLVASNLFAQETDNKAKLQSTAETLAADKKYQPKDGKTFCNFFVRDFAKTFLGKSLAELDGAANSLYDNLAASDNWTSYDVGTDAATAFSSGQKAANQGKLVVVSYKNSDATKPGHIAIIVPSKEAGGELVASGKWSMKVPLIASAGKAVFGYKALSFGFTIDKKKQMKVYVYKN